MVDWRNSAKWAGNY